MNSHEYSSQVWREHCAKVRDMEKARRHMERGKVKIGGHYVPPTYKVDGCVELPDVGEPSIIGKFILGILMVAAFLLLAWIL